MAQFIRGIRAIEAARHGAPLYVFNQSRGWVPAGPGALDRAERIIDINARMGVPYTDGLGDYGVPRFAHTLHAGRRTRRRSGRGNWQENPVKAGGISLETGLLIAGGVALLGGIGYLIYNAVQQANATAAATNAQLAQTNATGQQLAATAQQAQQLLPGSSSTLPYYAIPGTPPAVQAAGNQAAAASVGL